MRRQSRKEGGCDSRRRRGEISRVGLWVGGGERGEVSKKGRKEGRAGGGEEVGRKW